MAYQDMNIMLNCLASPNIIQTVDDRNKKNALILTNWNLDSEPLTGLDHGVLIRLYVKFQNVLQILTITQMG